MINGKALVHRLRTGPLSRLLARLAHVRPTESAFILAAHLFLSVFPLLIIISVIAPEAARGVAAVMRQRLGLTGASASTMRDLVHSSPGDHGAITIIGALMALVSATSFTRALQRLYERSWQVPALGLKGSWRGAIWLVGFLAYLEIIVLSGRLTQGSPLQGIGTLVWLALLWWWTPYLLLGGRVRWRSLVPTAVLSAVALAVLGLVSARYMPYALTTNERKYGTLGVVFALESWLAVVCGALVFSAVLGAHAAQSRGPLSRWWRGSSDTWER
ncbi:MAG: ribonuclease BN [Nonomuraea sp.]|nr:ribonuclease BN [Nonomuraea sp.]